MKRFIQKPHLFFFILIPIIILLGFLYKNETIDINVYTTYFVLGFSNLSYLFVVFFGLIGLNYFSFIGQKKLQKNG